MSSRKIIIAGGGPAGFFAAIACAEANPEAEIAILEKGPNFLTKVRISGGGRCNVTHACFEPRQLAQSYPRGERALIGPFNQFQPRDTVAWFESRCVELKTEKDGRIFPATDSSQTIIDCLLAAAKSAGVKPCANLGVARANRKEGGGFDLILTDGESVVCDRLLLATGGCRAAAGGGLAVSLGHTLEPPVPSLFTFNIEHPWLRSLSGISVESVEASIPSSGLRERGPILLTHWGLSGPVILRLSAWGARKLHDQNYDFPLQVKWLPHLRQEQVAQELQARRQQHASRLILKTPFAPLPARLWEQLALNAGVTHEMRWASLPRSIEHELLQQLIRTELPVTGKSLNKDEFVTCGGVRLSEVNFKTMESRLCPGLYFAGELLDIDGITGGFNFQAAWTTGWLAGRAMAED